MDDRDLTEEPDLDVVRPEVRDRDRLRRLLEERLPSDERAVGIRAEEVVRQKFLEPTDIRALEVKCNVAYRRVQRGITTSISCAPSLRG